MREEFEVYNFFKTPEELKAKAKEGLKGNYGKSLAINFLLFLSRLCFYASIVFLVITLLNINNYEFNLILFIILTAVFLFISILTYGPLKISQCKHSINVVENTNPKFKDISFGFANKYGRNVGYGITLFFTYLIYFIALIFPFFKKFISCQISGFILAENLEIKSGEAIRLAGKLSKGNTGKFLKLFFSFFVSFLLCIITALVFTLWVRPKYNATLYCYYKDIKE